MGELLHRFMRAGFSDASGSGADGRPGGKGAVYAGFLFIANSRTVFDGALGAALSAKQCSVRRGCPARIRTTRERAGSDQQDGRRWTSGVGDSGGRLDSDTRRTKDYRSDDSAGAHTRL